MALKRILDNLDNNMIYVWDTNKKRWLLTPDFTAPVLESTPPPGGYVATNIYVDSDKKRVVINYNNPNT